MKGKKNEMKKQGEEEKKEGEEKEGEEKEEGLENSDKSEDLTGDDLEKSLQALEAAAEDDEVSRKDVLLEKAKTGLVKAEQDELYQLLGKESEGKANLSEEIVKGMTENKDLQDALDVSEYLREQHIELCKSLEDLADVVEKGGNRQYEFNRSLARGVAQTGMAVMAMSDMVKSIATRIGVVEQEPARAPKAMRSTSQPMEKSFGGQPAQSEQLSKSQILDTLEEMLQESVEKGQGGASIDGTDLAVAAAKMESFGAISDRLLGQVKARRQRGANTVQ